MQHRNARLVRPPGFVARTVSRRPLPRPSVRCMAIFVPAKFDPASVKSYKDADKATVERALAELHARLKVAEHQRAPAWEVCELISACARHKMIAEAEAIFDVASARGGDIQRMEWVLHRAWCTSGEVTRAEAMLQRGSRREPSFKHVHGMLLLYARMGDIPKLEEWMGKARSFGVLSLAQYNVILSGFATVNPPAMRRIREILNEMMNRGIRPDDASFGMLIGNSAQRKDIPSLEALLDMAKEDDVVLNTKLYTAAINTYITSGDKVDYFQRLPLYKKARELFDLMQQKGCTPNEVTYNTIIKACTTAAEAESIWQHMQSNHIAPSPRFFNAMLSLLAQRGMLTRLVYFTELMREKGIRPDLSTFVNLIVGLCNAKLPFEALSYWEEMQRLGFNHRDPRVLRALYLAFAAAHRMDKAKYFAEQWQTLYGAVPPTMPSVAQTHTDAQVTPEPLQAPLQTRQTRSNLRSDLAGKHKKLSSHPLS